MRSVTTGNAAAVNDEVAAEVEGLTVLGGFLETVQRCGDADALRWRTAQGEWTSLSWFEFRDRVAAVANGLLNMGIGKGDFVLISANNRPEPHILDLAVQAVGGVPCSVYTTLPADQFTAVVENSQAALVVMENEEGIDRVLALRERLPTLRQMVVLDGSARPGIVPVTEWAALGSEPESSADVLAEGLSRITSDDLATVVYSSGTTGAVKGVMLTHRNIRWAIAAGFREEGEEKPEDKADSAEPAAPMRFLSYLPLATVGARMVDLWAHVVLGGATVHFCPDPSELVTYMREVSPTIFLGVPAIFEKLHTDLLASIEAEPDQRRRDMIRRCQAVGRQLARFRQRGESVPDALADQVAQAQRVLRAVRKVVGLDQCARAVSGGAPIGAEILDFFEGLGLSMTQSWGMTELTTAVTSDGPTGSVGRAYPGAEIRLADDDEILIRGGMVMKGYYRNPEATAEVLDAEGWLRTGDLGAVDENGWLHIVGRKKEMIITAAGTNIAPMRIELLLQRHPLIHQACAFGDQRSHIAVLLTVEPERLREWARTNIADSAELSTEELCAAPGLLGELRTAVEQANADLPASDHVKRFRVLAAPWTVEAGELTPTFKKRRTVIEDEHRELIDAMYGVGDAG